MPVAFKNFSTQKNYRWIIVIVGFLLQITSLGFARFAYTVILPSMKNDLRFSNTRMGLLQTGIVTGYLLFSYLGGIFASRWNLIRVINLSVVMCGLAMIGLGFVSPFHLLFLLTLLVGVGSSGAYIPLVPLVIGWFSSKRSGLPLGLAFSGSGVGIILLGYFVPFLLAQLSPSGWRVSWISLGGMTLVTALVSFFLLKEWPGAEEKNSDVGSSHHIPISIWRLLVRNRSVFTILVVYFLIGFAYIMYATFFVTYAVEEVLVTKTEAGLMWSAFGVFSVLGCFLWGAISDFLGRKWTTAWDILILSASILISVLWVNRIGLYVSVILFAFALNGFITLIAAMFGDHVEVTVVGEIFGLSTLIHGLGMAIGASLTGYLKDLTSTFQVPFLVSGATVGFCFFIFILFYEKGKKAMVF